MNVNMDFIEARIEEINDVIQMLRKLAGKEFDELNIYERLSIKYLIIQLVEASASICLHILVNVFGERADGFPECFARLGVNEVIPKELAEKLSAAARLKNLLVHRYWTIDDKKVYESIKVGLMDFERYTSHLRHFLAADPDYMDEIGLKFKYYELSSEEKAKVVESIRKELKSIEGVIFAYIHGGFIERPFFRDVDIAVWIKSPERVFDYTVNLSASLAALIGYPIDLHILNEAPLPFKYHVFTRGKLLFSKDEKLRAIIVDETLRRYIDFMELTRKLYISKRNNI